MQQILVHGSGGATIKILKNIEVTIESDSGQRVKEFEEHKRNNLDCLEQTVNIHRDVKNSTGEGSEGSEDHGREKKIPLDNIKIIVNRLSVGRIMMLKVLLEGNKHVIGKLEGR